MDILILALATWRISSLLVEEDGPFMIFERLRERAGVYYDEFSHRNADNELGRALCCLWCVSVWVGAAWTVTYYVLGDPTVWVALSFALSAGAVLAEELIGKER